MLYLRARSLGSLPSLPAGRVIFCYGFSINVYTIDVLEIYNIFEAGRLTEKYKVYKILMCSCL